MIDKQKFVDYLTKELEASRKMTSCSSDFCAGRHEGREALIDELLIEVKAGKFDSSSFTVKIKEVGPKKIGVMIAIRELLFIGLKEAKEMVESVPVVVLSDVSEDRAEAVKSKLVASGAAVEIS